MSKFNLLFFAKLFIFFYVVAPGKMVYAQEIYSSPVDYYSVPMKRLLAVSAGNYINQITQGQVDPDSAIMMACTIYHINRLIPYNETYDGDALTPGMLLINAGKIQQAVNLLRTESNKAKLSTLLELASYNLIDHGHQKALPDSSFKYINRAKDLTLAIGSKQLSNAVRDSYGKYYFKIGNLKLSQAYFDEITKSLTGESEVPELAFALAEQATYLPYNAPAKLVLLRRSLILCQKYGLKVLEIKVLTSISTADFKVNFKRAVSEITEVGELQKAIGFRHLQYVSDVLAYISDQVHDYKLGLAYATQSLKYMQNTGDKALSSIFFLRMGQLTADFRSPKEAIDWYQKGLNEGKSKYTQVFWYVCFLQEGRELSVFKRYREALQLIIKITADFPPENVFDKMQIGELKGECYESLGKYREAEEQFNIFLLYATKFPLEYTHDTELSEAYVQIAYLYFLERKFSKARVMAEKSLTAVTPSNNGVILSSYYLISYKLDSVAGDFISTFRDFKKYKTTEDSIANISEQNKFNELRIFYETKKKDNDIKLLKQSNVIQGSKLRHSDFVKNIILISVIAVSLIAALLFYLFRLKQKSNLKLQKQQVEISEKNDELERLLTEKEWLVREIHHRVKNNLHTIVSLLESQTTYLGNDALAAVRDSQHRVHAMSLIHQKLYLSENVSSVNMSVYIRELVGYLKDSFKTDNTIYFNLEVESIELDVATAIPLGLILNEAITNSIKYAFGEAGGEVTLQLIKKESFYLLTIADNGIGISKDFQQATPVTSLGMTLMKGLCKEIGAEFHIKADKGTIIAIKFSGKNLDH